MQNQSPLHLLHRAGQVADMVSVDAIEALAITPRQLMALRSIRARGMSDQTAIVQDTGIDRSTIAAICKRLEGRGLITRERSMHDARVLECRVTPKGAKLRKRLIKPIFFVRASSANVRSWSGAN
jgi:DNA-binding MarR family transcriptional regulator